MGTYSLMHLIWTVALFVIFIGIASWAWSAGQKHRFERAARAPFDDGEGAAPAVQQNESTRRKEESAFLVISVKRTGRERDPSGE